MKIQITAAAALFAQIGFPNADSWSADKFNSKISKLGAKVDELEKFDVSAIEDKASKRLFAELCAALKAEKGVTVVEDEKSTANKKTDTDDEVESAEAADEEAPAEDSDEEAKDDADEGDEGDEGDEKPAPKSSSKGSKKPAAKPTAKKSTKPAPAAKPTAKVKGGKSKFREGSAISKLFAELTAKPQTQNELTEAAGLSGTNYEALSKLVKLGHAVRQDNKDGSITWKRK